MLAGYGRGEDQELAPLAPLPVPPVLVGKRLQGLERGLCIALLLPLLLVLPLRGRPKEGKLHRVLTRAVLELPQREAVRNRLKVPRREKADPPLREVVEARGHDRALVLWGQKDRPERA